MVRELNVNKREHLKNELKLVFPDLSDADLNSIDRSFDELVESISLRTQRDKSDVARVVENKLDYIHSKNVF